MEHDEESIIKNKRVRAHALQRMFQRRIQNDAVYQTLVSGEVLEGYPDDLPNPSRLIMGWHEGRPLHVVAAFDSAERKEIVITV